jgi:hypothetical protein
MADPGRNDILLGILFFVTFLPSIALILLGLAFRLARFFRPR